ncbi:signal recognition particle protein [Sedimenticola selenatireducens]|uniref:Signal recognition particle protein n=1 Tax=Sedimenticola selenatireducens TaxID=191960 RepID=A0A558E0K4_9GAMM|nr:signal recognition particle protein [Sedimenticola selenatireducens]TVO75290.1 signal recognition particle protein [Sedimenticola selenatireducens]TVT66857.1 MAG: signal recognition particle protein [Sedimenticola selenatireducens]
MFDNLTDRLGGVLDKLRGQGRLTEENIQETAREIRMALLEADVALPVVREFVDQVKAKALGEEVMRSLTPGQVLIKIVNDELVRVMGEANAKLNLAAQPPAVILMAGLQGSGKTTSVAKLARWLKETQKKSVMVVSCDVYRPAAIDQLKTLAAEVEAEFYPSTTLQKPLAIAKAALDQARRQFVDVLIVDTAGRLHIDASLMDEIKQLHAGISPVETLFVVDSMTGQDAANTAKAFDDALPLTGVILTKTDGDARGGAALSIRQITGKPIKFLGVGEKTTALEPFHPERMASRILGMGDVLSLVEEVQGKVDQAKAEKLAKKLHKGQGFDLEDFRDQMEQMSNMGGLNKLMDKLPGMGNIPDHVKNQVNDKELVRTIAIINSMTPQERRFPNLIKGSRKRRIALGSGTQVQEVNKMLKQFTQMQKMMKKMKGGGMAKMMRGLKSKMGPGGGMPPGGMPPGGGFPF